LKDDEKELRERWDRDAPKCWRIMPWCETEWWVLGPDNKSVGRFWPTREEAFRVAYDHNSKSYGIYAVLVLGTFGKMEWERE
jgi:hypothetical protein